MLKHPHNHQLAELNIGRLVAATDDPGVAEFMDNLDRIHGLDMSLARQHRGVQFGKV